MCQAGFTCTGVPNESVLDRRRTFSAIPVKGLCRVERKEGRTEGWFAERWIEDRGGCRFLLKGGRGTVNSDS